MASTGVATSGAKNAFGVDIGGKTFLRAPKYNAPGRSVFATFLILCPTSFFLGILYSQFPYDYPILWAAPASTLDTVNNPLNASAALVAALDILETHMKILHNSPPLIPRILYIVIGTGMLGFFLKLIRPTESNLLFDGASLALYVVGIVIFITNIVKGMRMASTGVYATPGEVVRQDAHPFTPEFEGVGIGREDSLRVLSASNTILALVLIGILVLQGAQAYAERKERQEFEKMQNAPEEATAASTNRERSSATGSGSSKDKKRV